MLKQEYAAYQFIRSQTAECDKVICEQLMKQIAKVQDGGKKVGKVKKSFLIKADYQLFMNGYMVAG